MPLPDYFLQELKARSDIGEVVSAYVRLKRQGKNLLGLCPFHNEKTPSFGVSTENGYYHCFGCGAGGDVITFIKQIENLDYMEAIRFLAGRAGLQVPENGVDDSMAKLRGRVLEVNRETARFYHECLFTPVGKAGLDYFLSRGLDMKLVRHFGLGFAPMGRFALVDRLVNAGYTAQELTAANVAFLSKTGKPVDRFYGRAMFPIIDLRGNVVAFGGRILTDEKPKYINTSDTPVYKKSAGLFAMNFAKSSGGPLILAEGYMDVIALHGAGFTGAIASLGTSLTVEQAKVLSRYGKEVVICYDSDEAGQKAAQRAIPILRDAGLLVKVLTVPGGKDPDDFMRNNGKDGPAKFKMLLESSGNDVEYRLAKLRSGFDLEGADGKVQYLTAAAEVLGTLENGIEREVYAGRLAAELQVDKAAILNQAVKNANKRYKNREKQDRRDEIKTLSAVGDRVNPHKAGSLKVANAEEGLIAYLFANPDGADFCRGKLQPENFCTDFGRRIYGFILEKNTNDTGISLTDFSQQFTAEELSSLSRTLYRFENAAPTQADATEYMKMILRDTAFANADSIRVAGKAEINDYLQQLKNSKK